MEAAAAMGEHLIPGLPHDIAMLCLLKVPRIYHTCLASVCIAWRKAVRHPEFYRERRRLGVADAWLVLVSAEILSAPALLYSAYDLSTRQLLFKVKFPPSVEADERSGVNLTLADAANNMGGLPVVQPDTAPRLNYLDHYRTVAMNEFFAVLGFNRPSRSHAPRCTFTIYNTVTDEWRHAAPLSVCREMFACGVIGKRFYVAGGLNAKGETERTTEVYDFENDTWTMAAALPAGVLSKIQADAVFQGKLYVQSSSFWVYNPRKDTWQQEGGLVGAQQLLATEKFLYAMGAQQELFRYESSHRKWKPVDEHRLQSRLTARANKLGRVRNFNHTAQRAFGHGDDIFFLIDSTSPCGMPSDGVTRCHRLFSVRPSWYHAGAVVSA